MTQSEIAISQEFKSLIPPLSETEKEQLEANLIKEGCRDPLVVWNGILIDGHNRLEICMNHGLEFKVVEKDFANKDEAKDWMDANQLGRRNLSPDAFRLLLGRRYNRTKKKVGASEGNFNALKQKDQSDPIESTADKLADKHGVSAPTVKRAGQLAEAVEKLEIETEVASGEIKAPQKVIVQAAKSLPDNPTAEEVQEARKHVHVAQNSGENEWYTPSEFIESARLVMGSIDLDPASSEIANRRVKATSFFTKEDDGLKQDWSENIWMNPPYAQPLISKFSSKISQEFKAGNIKQAIVLVNNATETKWFQVMAEQASALCFPKGRIKFLTPEGEPSGAPLQGQAIFYFGENNKEFQSEFLKYGFTF